MTAGYCAVPAAPVGIAVDEVTTVDKKQVRLAILASAIIIGVPLIVNVVHDLLSSPGGADRQFGEDAGRSGRAAPHPRSKSIEDLAADLRRLRAAVATDQHRSATHQHANRMAYDHLLMQVCEMVNCPCYLNQATMGSERDIERIRTEAELERAGVIISTAGRSSSA